MNSQAPGLRDNKGLVIMGIYSRIIRLLDEENRQD